MTGQSSVFVDARMRHLLLCVLRGKPAVKVLSMRPCDVPTVPLTLMLAATVPRVRSAVHRVWYRAPTGRTFREALVAYTP